VAGLNLQLDPAALQLLIAETVERTIAALGIDRARAGTDAPPTSGLEPLLVDKYEAARLVGISPRRLWDMTMPRGDLPCVRIRDAGEVQYRLVDLRAWIQRKIDDPPAARPAPSRRSRPRRTGRQCRNAEPTANGDAQNELSRSPA
jgi:hypothetical protein